MLEDIYRIALEQIRIHVRRGTAMDLMAADSIIDAALRHPPFGTEKKDVTTSIHSN